VANILLFTLRCAKKRQLVLNLDKLLSINKTSKEGKRAGWTNSLEEFSEAVFIPQSERLDTCRNVKNLIQATEKDGEGES
jgi:hypothetical protein